MKQLSIWILSLLVFQSWQAWSASPSDQIFNFDGKKIAFRSFPEKRLLISRDCFNQTHSKSCLAEKAWSSLKKDKPILTDRAGGAEPGSRICTDILHGEVRLGKDKDIGVNSFCRFQDGSMIDCGSLAFAALSHN